MELSFGAWLKQRRRTLDLTQEDLAHKASCSIITIRKIESADLAPSKELAWQLGLALAVPELDQAAFIAFARTERATAPVTAFAAPPPGSQVARAQPTPTTFKFRLPAQMTAVIGRERDTSVGCKLIRLPGVRLVTLTGPPGTGKTRLSLEIAEALQTEFESGACFVPLAPLSQPHLVEAAIAQALGLHESAQQSLLATLRNYLRDKRLLLVLDNFEHVLPAAAIVTELLAAAPDLKALVSSREALRVYGERELPVPPLALPELNPLPPLAKLANYPSIRLFEERAQASKPDFELTPANSETVARICACLDGLPLAIEMAAAQVKWRSPQTLLAQLKQSLTVLTSSLRHLPPRQQTLHGAIEWSYSLLAEEERRLFNILGVFAGGCTLAAIEAVCAGPALRVEEPETGNIVFPLPALIPTQLVSLVDKNLLRYDLTEEGEPRFWMLETMREYAREQLVNRGHLAAVQRQHALYYLSLVEQAELIPAGPPEKRWLDGLEREHDNLRAALSWALATPSNSEELIALRLCAVLGSFWKLRGHWSEGIQWLQQALELDPDEPGPEARRLRAGVLYGLARLVGDQGNYGAARSFYQESLRLRRELGDKRSIVQSLVGLGWVCCLHGEPAEGRAWAEEAQAISQELNDQPHQRIQLLNLMGWVSLNYDGYLTAQTYYEASLTLSRQVQDKHGVANALSHLGICAYCLGNYVEARAAYVEGLALQRELGNAQGVRHSLAHLGLCAIDQGDDAAADTWLQECLALAEPVAENVLIALVLRNLGWLALFQGDLVAARRRTNESLAIGQLAGDKIVAVRLAWRNLAEIDLAEGNYASAGKFAKKWLHVWRELNDREDTADALRLAGFAALGGQGDQAAARDCFEEALALRQSVGHQPDMAEAWFDLGYLALKEDNLAQAAQYYRDSLRMAQQCLNKRRIAFALRALATLAAQQGQLDRAARLLGASETVEVTLTARLQGLPLLMQQDWANSVSFVQTQLGEASFTAAQMEGRVMPLDQAIAYALADIEG